MVHQIATLPEAEFKKLAAAVGRRLEKETNMSGRAIAAEADLNHDGVVTEAELSAWWRRRAPTLLAVSASRATEPPTRSQLMKLGLVAAVPCFTFGFLDNAIMLVAGEQIEAHLGMSLGLSAMACAAMGNIVAENSVAKGTLTIGQGKMSLVHEMRSIVGRVIVIHSKTAPHPNPNRPAHRNLKQDLGGTTGLTVVGWVRRANQGSAFDRIIDFIPRDMQRHSWGSITKLMDYSAVFHFVENMTRFTRAWEPGKPGAPGAHPPRGNRHSIALDFVAHRINIDPTTSQIAAQRIIIRL